MCTAALGATDDGTEVVGVGNAVADDDQRCLLTILCDLQNILHRAIFLFCRKRDHALMRGIACECVQLAFFGFDNGDLALQCLRDQNDDRAVSLTLLHQKLVHLAPGTEQLAYGVSADDRAVFIASVDRSLLLRLVLCRRAAVVTARGFFIFAVCIRTVAFLVIHDFSCLISLIQYIIT